VSDVAAVAVLLLDPRVDVRAITVSDAGTGVTSCASGHAVLGHLLDELRRADVPYACGGARPGPDALPFPPEWRAAHDVGWNGRAASLVLLTPAKQTTVKEMVQQPGFVKLQGIAG
jgi:inosine-uridine nucleoside N-ribohydrolase